MTPADTDPTYWRVIDSTGGRAADFASQILQTTQPFLSKPVHQLDVLDLGCAYGFTARVLAGTCRRVVGYEPSDVLYEVARQARESNLQIEHKGIGDLDVVEEFDLIVLDNVFEHLPDQREALRRIARALRPGGAVYILTPNKLWPIEAHYGLPFLAWLPLKWANAYLRITGRGTDYTDASYAPTYWRLKRLLKGQPELQFEFVVPGNLNLTATGAALHYRVGAALIARIPALWAISKGFLVIAYKREKALDRSKAFS